MLQELGNSKFPDHLLYLKEKVDELPEQDNYIPYQEDEFMFIFSNDKHENISLLSDLYGAESSRIDSLCVCRQDKEQLHDILNIMTRSMSKAKRADVPAIYPLKGVYSKPDHVKPNEVENKTGEQNLPKETEPIEMPVVVEETEIPKVHVHESERKQTGQTPVLEEHVRRPNPLLEPSSFPQVMRKQLPEYEGLLKPQPIEIELRGRLPSYEVDKAIEKYPFTMDIPSIEELKKKKRKLFYKIPEETVFRKHIPKQLELDKFIDALKEKVIHDYNIPVHVKALRAEYKRSPYFKDIVKYIKTGYCSYVGKAQRIFKMLCEEYLLMDGILFKIRYVKEHRGKPTLVLCIPEKYIPIILYQYHTPLLAGHPGVITMYQMIRKNYYFPTMLPLINQFVASCYECQSMKEKQPTLSKTTTRCKSDGKSINRYKRNAKIHIGIHLYSGVCM